MAKWAQSQYLDGVDFDLENLAAGFRAGSMSDKQTVDWIANLTAGAYSVLGTLRSLFILFVYIFIYRKQWGDFTCSTSAILRSDRRRYFMGRCNR